MSTQLQQEERKFEEAKQRLRQARIGQSRENVAKLLKSGSDKDLGEACRQLAGYLNPPNVGRKHKEQTVTSPIQ